MRKKTATKPRKKPARASVRKKSVARKSAAPRAAAKKAAARKSSPRSKRAVKAPAKRAASKPAVAKTKSAQRAPAGKPALKPKAGGKPPALKPTRKKTALKETAAAAKALPMPPALSAKGAAEVELAIDESKLGRMTAGIYAGIVVCENPGRLPKRPPYSKRELERLRQKLLDEREEIAQSLTHLDQMAFSSRSYGVDNKTPGYSTDQAEFASDFQAADTSLGLRAMEETRRAQVEEATARLDEGFYGVCVACGAKIGYQRLLATPFAVLCISCRGNYEKRRIR